MPALKELIRVLIPILPDAEVTECVDGQIVILTGDDHAGGRGLMASAPLVVQVPGGDP